MNVYLLRLRLKNTEACSIRVSSRKQVSKMAALRSHCRMNVSGPIVCVVPLDLWVSNWLFFRLWICCKCFFLSVSGLEICMFVSFLMSVSGREDQ